MGIRYLTHDAVIQCAHGGRLQMFPPLRRSLYSGGSPVVIESDLFTGKILGCPQPFKPCISIEAVVLGRAPRAIVDGDFPILTTLQAVTDGGVSCYALLDTTTRLEVASVVVDRPFLAEPNLDRSWWACFLIALAKALFWLGAAIALTYVLAGLILLGLLLAGIAATFTTVLAIVGLVLALVFVLYEMYTRYNQYTVEHGKPPSELTQLKMFAVSLLSLTGVTAIVEGFRGKRFFSEMRLPKQGRWDSGVGGVVQLVAIALGIVARVRGRGAVEDRPPGFMERINGKIEAKISDWAQAWSGSRKLPRQLPLGGAEESGGGDPLQEFRHTGKEHVKQISPIGCGAAAGEMVARELGVEISQEQLLKSEHFTPDMPLGDKVRPGGFHEEGLAQALEETAPIEGRRWTSSDLRNEKGELLGAKRAPKPKELSDGVNRAIKDSGSSVIMRVEGGKHYIVVDSVNEDGTINIRDPREQGPQVITPEQLSAKSPTGGIVVSEPE